jgi:hypothetical protein
MKPILITLCLLAFLAPGVQAQPDISWLSVPEWSFPLVPTNALHTPPNVILPPILYGNEQATYLNFFGLNAGNAGTESNLLAEISLDGEVIFGSSFGPMPAGQWFVAADLGPVNIRGGRHNLTIRYDPDNTIPESDETNNTWGRQFVWSPLMLPPDTPIFRDAPPLPSGGAGDLTVPAPAYNCDGFEFVSGSVWSAITLSSLDGVSDYDLAIFDPPLDLDDAFTSSLTGSYVASGDLDYVMVNRQQTGITDFHAGVTRYNGDSSFVIERRTDLPLQPNVSVDHVLDSGDFLGLFSLDIEPQEVGEMLVQVESPGSLHYTLQVFSPSLPFGGRNSYEAYAVPDENGTINLVMDFAEAGQYALVVCRDWIHGDAPLEYTIRTATSYLDLKPVQMANWHSPLVPRNAADGTVQSMPLSPSLPGWVPDTYFNQAVGNRGNIPASGVQTWSTMDGLALDSGYGHPLAYLDILYPGGNYPVIHIGPKEVPGGRHTWVLEVDPLGNQPDYDRSNNFWGEQFVWEPAPLTFGGLYAEENPGLAHGDFGRVTSGEPASYNCNGYQIGTSDQYWRAVAIAANPGNDMDLALFPPSGGSKDGFLTDLALSWFGPDHIEYVLINDNLITLPDLDVGVYRFSGESPHYWMDASVSITLFDPIGSPLGPATLGPGDLIDIYDIFLAQGTHNFRLENLDGFVDWGMQLHPADQPYGSRDHWVGNGLSFANGPGKGESFVVDVPQDGWYGLTVYKNSGASSLETGTYRVLVNTGLSPVEPVPTPGQPGIHGVHPNPFNPETTLQFFIDQAGPVLVEVFNVQGALVATLLDQQLPAGTHQATWQGRDLLGRTVPSGVYLARLKAGDQQWSRKLMLVK